MEDDVVNKRNLKKINKISRAINTLVDAAPSDANKRDEYFEYLYSKVFSDNVSSWVLKEFPDIRDYWCDPDTTYEADLLAFKSALEQYMDDKELSNTSKDRTFKEIIDSAFMKI